MKRLEQQKRADLFDSDVFVLLGIAEKGAESSVAKEKAAWTEVQIYLRRIRSLVRPMMHEADRKATPG